MIMIKQHLYTKFDRMALYALVSVLANSGAGLIALYLGIVNKSFWLVTNAVYYLILFFSRGYALWQYTNTRKKLLSNQQKFMIEYLVYHRTALFIILLGCVYIVLNVCLYYYGNGVNLSYDYNTTLIIATLSFIKMGLSIRGIVANRYFKNPIITTIKIITMMDALVTIVLTQRVLLLLEKEKSAITSSVYLGILVGAIMVIFGSYMLSKKHTTVKWQSEPMKSENVIL